jgi:hypothetical protein
MAEYKTLLEFSSPEYVKSLEINRLEEQGLLKVLLEIKKGEKEENIELFGFTELAESVGKLLEAESVVISKELASWKEFGAVRIECWVDEDYFEYTCDKAV